MNHESVLDIRDVESWAYYMARKYGFVPWADQDLLNDAASLAMMTLVRKIPDYDPSRGVPFSAYVTPFIRGVLLDERYRGLARDRDISDFKAARLSPSEDSMLTRIVIRGVVAQLPEQERSVIEALYFEDLTARQYAKSLGVTESRISQIKKKATERMADMLRAA